MKPQIITPNPPQIDPLRATLAVKQMFSLIVLQGRNATDIGFRNPINTKVGLAKLAGVKHATFREWYEDRAECGKFKAHAMIRLIEQLRLGGITFTKHKTPEYLDMLDLFRLLTGRVKELEWSNAHFMSAMGWRTPQIVPHYLNDFKYFQRNISMYDLVKWGYAVGLGMAEPHITVLDGDAHIVGAFSEKRPRATHKPTMEHQLEDDSVDPRLWNVSACKWDVQLHLPLYHLMDILQKERIAQGKELKDLRIYSCIAPGIMERWDKGLLLNHNAGERYELAVSDLSTWAEQLGFGGIDIPYIGHDWTFAVGRLYATVSSTTGIGDQKMEGLLGQTLARSIKPTLASSNKLISSRIPVVYLEYLSVAGHACGMGFRKRIGHSGIDHAAELVPKYPMSVFETAGRKLRNRLVESSNGNLSIRSRVSRLGYNSGTSPV